MTYTVTMNKPGLPKGTELGVNGLGLLKNGSGKRITAEEEESFIAHHGMTVKEYFKDDEDTKVEGSTEIKKVGDE